MGRTVCTEPQCLYKGDLYLYLTAYVGTLLSNYIKHPFSIVPPTEHLLLSSKAILHQDTTAQSTKHWAVGWVNTGPPTLLAHQSKFKPAHGSESKHYAPSHTMQQIQTNKAVLRSFAFIRPEQEHELEFT
jgi:hypothetical protein